VADLIRYRPRDEQRELLDFQAERLRTAWWATMGAGKTVTAATHIADSLDGDVLRWCVVAPKLVAEQQWPQELRKWRHLAHLRFRNITFEDLGLQRGCVVERDGQEVEIGWREKRPGEVVIRSTGMAFVGKKIETKRRLRDLLSSHRVGIMSYDVFPWAKKAFGSNWPYDGIVFDEAPYVADHESLRWQAAKHAIYGSSKSPPRVSQVIELSGLPAANGIETLWGQMFLLDGGEAMGRTLTEFRETWCVPDQTNRSTGRVYRWKVAAPVRAGLMERIAKRAKSVTFDPGVEWFVNDIELQLDDASRAVYDDLEGKLIHRFVEEGGYVLAANQAVKVGKLMQVCQGAIYDSDRLVRILHQLKLDRLQEIFEARTGPILVAYPYVPNRQEIRKRFGAKVKLANETGAIEEFKSGKLPMLAAHPEMMAHGMDGLQLASNEIVWYGAPHRYDHYAQLNARLVRVGQQKTVVVHRLLAADTLEVEVANQVLRTRAEDDETLRAAVAALAQRRKNHA